MKGKCTCCGRALDSATELVIGLDAEEPFSIAIAAFVEGRIACAKCAVDATKILAEMCGLARESRKDGLLEASVVAHLATESDAAFDVSMSLVALAVELAAKEEHPLTETARRIAAMPLVDLGPDNADGEG